MKDRAYGRDWPKLPEEEPSDIVVAQSHSIVVGGVRWNNVHPLAQHAVDVIESLLIIAAAGVRAREAKG